MAGRMQGLVLVNTRFRTAAQVLNLCCPVLYVHVSKTEHYFLGMLALIIEAMVADSPRSSFCMSFDLPTRALSSLP
jgi:hypothetical protein